MLGLWVISKFGFEWCITAPTSLAGKVRLALTICENFLSALMCRLNVMMCTFVRAFSKGPHFVYMPTSLSKRDTSQHGTVALLKQFHRQITRGRWCLYKQLTSTCVVAFSTCNVKTVHIRLIALNV